jgi:hypothetical protein
VEIDPAKQVALQIRFFIDPDKYKSCSLKNTARILKAAGGTLQNQNAADDEDSATLGFPPAVLGGKAYCHTPVPAKPCPPGFDWKDGNCKRIGITTPIPPVRECPKGTVGKYPNCRDNVSTPRCTGGRIKVRGKCICRGSRVWNGKRCIRPQCPKGTVGKYPNCRDKVTTPRCTGGRVKVRGKCICRGSRVWNGKRCVQRHCPKGTVGKYPNCRKVILRKPVKVAPRKPQRVAPQERRARPIRRDRQPNRNDVR